ncbi:MAG: type II and III secretion system protein [Sulfuricella denitrificans]|nr:type II and III secretion system protein [Sulfuricella denitrificans]
MLRLNFTCRHKLALLLLATALLAGCAGQRLQREGQALLEEGRIEEGLAKLGEASKAEPDNLSYRAALVRNRDQVVNRLLSSANSARATDHPDVAQAIYERILAINPASTNAREGLESLVMERRHATLVAEAERLFKKGDFDAARASLKPVFLENPRHGKASLLLRQIDEQAARMLVAEPVLKGKFKKPVTLQFRDANLKMVFEALSRTSGINVILDKDVKPDIKTSIFVKDVSVEDAIDLILLQSQLEKKIISDNTLFIYPNTAAKLKDYQDLKIRSFHLTNADPKQMLVMIKTLLKTKDIFIHEKTNSIVIRDTNDAIRLVEKMIADQDIAEPEVMLEVEVMEVSSSRLSELGLKFPNQFTFTGLKGSEGAAGPTIAQLRKFYWQDFAISPVFSTTLNLKLEDGDTNVLASPRIRVRNREKAKIMIGSRVPVITNAITPVSTGTPVITGSVQYLDVGLKLEVEPDIHLDSEVSIKVALDVSSIIKEVPNVQSGTLAYEIGTRNASTVLRLKDGETQILAGLINDEDRKIASKVPGLGQMPMLGRLFASHKDDTKKTEIVLSITPRIVGTSRLPDAREVEFWAGTEASLRSNPLLLRPLGTVALNSSGTAAAAGRTPPAAPRSSAPAKAVQTPPLALSWQGPNQAKVGDRISLTLSAQSSQEVDNIGFLVGFDPSVLKAVDVAEGSFMKQSNMPSTLNKTIDQAGGQVLVDLSGTGSDGASTGGSVVTLVFEVTAAAPQSQITVSRIVSSGTGGEALAFAAPEPHTLAVVQ